MTAEALWRTLHAQTSGVVDHPAENDYHLRLHGIA